MQKIYITYRGGFSPPARVLTKNNEMVSIRQKNTGPSRHAKNQSIQIIEPQMTGPLSLKPLQNNTMRGLCMDSSLNGQLKPSRNDIKFLSDAYLEISVTLKLRTPVHFSCDTRTIRACGLHLSHKLRCYTRISGPEKSHINTREKISYFFPRVLI